MPFVTTFCAGVLDGRGCRGVGQFDLGAHRARRIEETARACKSDRHLAAAVLAGLFAA